VAGKKGRRAGKKAGWPEKRRAGGPEKIDQVGFIFF